MATLCPEEEASEENTLLHSCSNELDCKIDLISYLYFSNSEQVVN